MHRELESLVARLLLSSDPKDREAAEELKKLAEDIAGKGQRIATLEFEADALADLTREMKETTQIWLNRLADRPKHSGDME